MFTAVRGVLAMITNSPDDSMKQIQVLERQNEAGFYVYNMN